MGGEFAHSVTCPPTIGRIHSPIRVACGTPRISAQLIVGSGESHGESCTGEIDKERQRAWGEDDLVKPKIAPERRNREHAGHIEHHVG